MQRGQLRKKSDAPGGGGDKKGAKPAETDTQGGLEAKGKVRTISIGGHELVWLDSEDLELDDEFPGRSG